MTTWKCVLLLSTTALFACSQQVTTVKTAHSAELAANNGYLLLSVDSSVDLEQLNISGQKSFFLGAADLSKGNHYLLVDLPAGDYQIDSVKLSQWWRLQLKAGYWNFSVHPGQISYIGELQLKGQAPELENRASMALQYLEKEHAKLLRSYQVRYSGPGDDHYFEFVAAKGAAK